MGNFRELYMTKIEASADVAESATIGAETVVWHLAQIREGARLGSNCSVGRGAYIGPHVTVGNNVKIQNYALIYEPATVGDGAFIGPAVTLTNDLYPRAVTESGELKGTDDWSASGVTVAAGASIGARAVVIAGVTIGAWALVGAGAVVTRDVPPHALVVGNPARRIGWVGVSGHRLHPAAHGTWRCEVTDERYVEEDGLIRRA